MGKFFRLVLVTLVVVTVGALIGAHYFDAESRIEVANQAAGTQPMMWIKFDKGEYEVFTVEPLAVMPSEVE